MPDNEIVFECLHCPCIYESAYATISIHKSREGAEAAMDAHRAKLKDEHDLLYEGLESVHPYDFAMDWKVNETPLLP